MKIKRFTAPSMREAIRLVRQEQGEDAVILGNRRVEGGVEVVAATDYDAALIQQATTAAVEPEPMPVPRVATPGAAAAMPPPSAPRTQFTMPPAAALPASKQEFDALKHEMSGLRQLMQQHIAGLAWNDLKQRN